MWAYTSSRVISRPPAAKGPGAHPAKNSVKNSVRRFKIEEVWSEWKDLNLRPPRPERGALPATLPFRLWTLSRSLLADNFRLMALDRRGPRQSDLWSASPSDKSPFLAVRSDRDQHVISLIVTGQVRLHFFPQTTVQNFLDSGI